MPAQGGQRDGLSHSQQVSKSEPSEQALVCGDRAIKDGGPHAEAFTL